MLDAIIIGGGPAGMFAAVTAARRGKKVLLLEKEDRLGKKLRITGKGRCNVTNDCGVQEVLNNVPRNGKFLYSAMTAFPPSKVMEFFEAMDCPLKTERGNRVFPQSDSAMSIQKALTTAMEDGKVQILHQKVLGILTENGGVTGVRTDVGVHHAGTVLLATGGCSYPATGSTGDGYKLASALGHSIVDPVGSLVPLESPDGDCKEMQGLSLKNVGVKLLDQKGRCAYKDFGELLFTHFGMSGPTVLSASAHMKKGSYSLVLDLKPALDEGKLEQRVLRDLEMYQNRSMSNALTDLLPRSMIPVILRRTDIDPEMQANSLTRPQRQALVHTLKNFSVEISGKRPVAEAIVTSGGIKTKEVDPKTMESKLVPGLYFAGEILDCDGYTGGFNLQIAWATAYAAAQSF